MKKEQFFLIEQEKIDEILQILQSLAIALGKNNNGGTANLKLYSHKEAERYLCMSESTLKNRRKNGMIDFIQDAPGAPVKFTIDQLKAYEEANTKVAFKLKIGQNGI